VLRPRIDDGSNKRLYLTKVNANDFLGLADLYFVLNGNIKDDLPFVVHTRDALDDTYEIIKSEGVGPRGGIMHSFSGTLEEAKRFMDLGMMISFSGVVTFKKATDIQEAAKELPLDKILVETDAPYLAPVPKRGRENKTAYTRYVVDFIAELRGMASEEVAQATYDNARKVFALD